MKVAIIGAGASGLVAGISAARSGDDVYVFEKNNDSGKKLLLTGNGRCNYGNTNQNLNHYHSYQKEYIPKIINEKNILKVNDFFVSIGIIPKNKKGYLYPFSEKSSSIKSALITECKRLNVHFRFNSEVKTIVLQKEGFIINNEYFGKVILATGSKSAPKTGSNGIGYEIAKNFGHQITAINPSLVQLVTNIGIENYWTGIRSEVKVSSYEDDIFKKEESGEIQLTNYGLSGICIFNLSRDIKIGLNVGKDEVIHINFLPWLEEDIHEFMKKRANQLKGRNITEICDGFLDYKLILALTKYLNIDNHKSYFDLKPNEKDLLEKSLIDFEVPITDTKTFNEAQTCSGGIPLSEINLNTLESLKQKGLFLTGELIDIDGDCGGYNLTIAWITGLLAGEHHD